MARICDIKSKPRQSVKFAAGLAIALVFGFIAGPAEARWGDRDDGPPHRDGRGDRGDHSRDRDDHRRNRHDWDGGYYRAPPVVYGGPYNNGYGYYPPPVVYGPGIGVVLPGLNINIR
ncbi:hypothetical protein [Telmatospirillum sp.]|uniref:hypothetical protein n=1 Tax=Telmatospirillum sp. TaxID=2079197 RepID=UPI002849BFEF|nr:hypothetical protein [Telmatospirillum sp.]MDR3440532.1 hypothetical protein [Telmatospirillum sp.]